MGLFERAVRVWRREGFGGLVRRGWRYLLWWFDRWSGVPSLLFVPYALWRFRRVVGVGDALDFVFGGSVLALLIRPMQVREEVAEFVRLVSRFRPRRVVEIGTARGGTLFLLSRAAADDAVIVSVDLPGGLFGGGYAWLKGVLFRCFATRGQRIVLIRGDSHDVGVFEEVRRAVGGVVDLLFIDGDHSYEGVKRDFEMYSRLVRRGGLIAFHDIVPGPEELVGGVPRFWRELKERYGSGRVLEIVKSWDQGGYGIGVLFV